jgi:3-phenylpropionate/trans-cinnamate dioxygenase ferredoxin reductase subunit
MSDARVFVIVGASVAGAQAATALRENGFEGQLVLVGEEEVLPYERPPLSKEYLLGKKPAEKAYVHPAEFYTENRIELRLGVRVTSIDPAARDIEFDGGERLHYDALLLATGSSVVPLNVPGAELSGVHYLRTLPDSTSLRSAIEGGGQVVIVGGGWIGLEVASAARSYGAEVVLIEPQAAPLLTVLGPELGSFYAQLHRDHGVDLRLGVGVSALLGEGGAVTAVVTSDGTEVPADVVVVGVGIRPRVELAEAAGLAVDDGILVDAYLRTSDPDIYAAGDVANAENPQLGHRVRVQHWANANDQGKAAGAAMAGKLDEPFAKVPYFFSDQYDVGMEYSGLVKVGEYDHLVFRGDPATREFCAFWLKDAVVLAGMNVNVWDVQPAIRKLIKERTPVDIAKLADPAVKIADAARAGEKVR